MTRQIEAKHPGARWWKFDFHTHTPASHQDYGKGLGQQRLLQTSPEEWLLGYMRAGIDCVAITDHNTGAWVDRLKEALSKLEAERPEGFRPLVLFPGVEISVNGGVHVLAILDLTKTTSEIDALLGAVDFPMDKRGSCEACSEASFPQVVGRISKAGGIPIPAHVDGSSGLFTLTGVTLDQALQCEEIIAMEMVDASSEKPQLYRDRKLAWTEVLGSDGHHPTGGRCPGSHFTWVKMGAPSLDGLRLALLDGPLSVRRSDHEPGDPNRHADLVIEAIEVENARYMGRSRSFEVPFSPWLNAVIGGRGTGKSTLVEFVRLALRRQNDLAESLVADFEKYATPYEDRTDDGLLTRSSRIAVIYRKDASRFRIQWHPSGGLESIQEETEPGRWESAQGDVRQRFPVRIYSQKEIFELAKAPRALLRIVDEAGDVDRQSWEVDWREMESGFLTLRAKAREIEGGLAEEPRLMGELADVKRKLKVFEEAGHAETLKQYQRRLRQERAVERWQESWADLGERFRQLAEQTVPATLEAEVFDPDDEADRSVQDLAARVGAQAEEIARQLLTLAEQAEQVRSAWTQDRSASVWSRAVEHAKSAFEELRQRLSAEGAGDPAAYGDLVQRRQILEERTKAFEERRRMRDGLEAEARVRLTDLLRLRRELTRRRQEFLARVLAGNPYVRIAVVPYGAEQTVEAELREIIHRDAGGFEKDIGAVGDAGLLGALYSGPLDAGAFESRLAELRSTIGRLARGQYDPSELRDQRFAVHLAKLPPETLDRLDLWFPEDSLEVRYSTTADGENLRSIQEGSPGQKTATLLAFLLSYGDEPIVLDQPEDDLDNHLIYDLIVQQLRTMKRRRQVLVVTHNANIVVNGDAELVVALTARGGETHKECEGPLQDRAVRDTICAIMEGGREAFEQRYRRIALVG